MSGSGTLFAVLPLLDFILNRAFFFSASALRRGRKKKIVKSHLDLDARWARTHRADVLLNLLS